MAAAAAAAMAEQEGARNGARNRGGVQRVEGKLRASVEKGDYYEAHQMYRTLFFRWARAVAWSRGPASAAVHWLRCGAPHPHWSVRLPVAGRSGGGGLGLLGGASSSSPGFPLLLLSTSPFWVSAFLAVLSFPHPSFPFPGLLPQRTSQAFPSLGTVLFLASLFSLRPPPFLQASLPAIPPPLSPPSSSPGLPFLGGPRW